MCCSVEGAKKLCFTLVFKLKSEQMYKKTSSWRPFGPFYFVLRAKLLGIGIAGSQNNKKKDRVRKHIAASAQLRPSIPNCNCDLNYKNIS